jgi:adenosylhomocysteine nucleosidase
MQGKYKPIDVAILAAFRLELEGMAAELEDVSSEAPDGPLRFVTGLRGTRSVLLGTTGMGKVRAAAAVQHVIDRFQAGRILFCGTAGGLPKQVKPLDLVVADRLLCHDTGPEDPAWVEADPALCAALERCAREALPDAPEAVHRGPLITGDRPVLAAREGKALVKRYHALAVDMEAAAAAAVAALNGVPLAVVKAVTDSADKNGIRDFKKNVKAAAARAQKAVLRFLDVD